MERLDKRITLTGRYSRKEAKALIRAGRVMVDGRPACRPEEKCGPEAEIKVDGAAVCCDALHYYMLHKPAGLLSATEDRAAKTVLDLFPADLRRIGLFPVGRLDRDTEGLLLVTNDGPLAHSLLSPRRRVDKAYYVQTDIGMDEGDVAAFSQGAVLGDGFVCMPAALELLPAGNEGILTIREGKYHQVKRMLASRGKRVQYLKRLSMGPLRLDPELEAGQWRALTREEQEALLSQ